MIIDAVYLPGQQEIEALLWRRPPASGKGVLCVSIYDSPPFGIRRQQQETMGTVEGQFVGWLEAERVAKPEQDAHAQVTALVEEYSTTLYRVAYSVTRNAADAEDVVQETFLRVLRHRNKLSEVRDYRVWLVRIAWNLVLDRKRRAKTRPETDDFEALARVLPAGELSAEKMVITAQRHARILRLIDTLPAREREVLLLSAVKELSTVEIALVLKTTESTIRSRLYRARQALAAMLEQEGSFQ
jgi:RNA polymerase sigma-70 factor (ECF subfamily)